MVLLAVGSAVYFHFSGRAMSDDGVADESARTTAATNSAQSSNADPRPSESRQVSATELTRPRTLLDRYVQSTNLLELVEQLRGDADAGSADAIRTIANAYTECVQYSSFPELLDAKRFDRSFSEPDRSIALALQKKQRDRCADLIANSGGTYPKDFEEALTRTVGLNDLIGQAEALLDEDVNKRRDPSTALSKDQIAALSSKIALSNDPEAIATLALSQYGPRDGGTANTYAWLLVACDLGRDCSADGLSMRRSCLGDRRCVSGGYRELLRRKILPPDQFDAAQIREREILQAIKSGDVSHLFP